jgi:hypothetical protein
MLQRIIFSCFKLIQETNILQANGMMRIVTFNLDFSVRKQ